MGLNSVYKLFLNIHKGTKPETALFTGWFSQYNRWQLVLCRFVNLCQ